MKKTLLLMAMFVAASSSFAQVQKFINKGDMTHMPEMSQKKAPAFQTLEDGMATPRRSVATNLYYTIPEGAAFYCWNKEGSGYAPSFLCVTPWKDFTFTNKSENPTTTKWHLNYLSSDRYLDVTADADAEGNYTNSLEPGYHFAAPTLTDELMTDSFTLGYPGAYWGAQEQYATYFSRIVVDSVATLAFLNDHGNAGSSGYGWGSLSTGYLYGTGTIDGTKNNRGIGVCKSIFQDYPKPMSPLYVEDIFITMKSVTLSPLPENGALTMLVLATKTGEDGKISQTGDTIAVLTATLDDFTLYGSEGTSSYSSTGKYQRYMVTFTKKLVDDFGGVMVDPFTIDKQFRIKIIGLDEEGVDVGISVSSGIDEEISGVGLGYFQIYYPDIDATYNHYYTGSAINFGFTAMFDAVEVQDVLTSGDNVLNDCNVLTVSNDGTQAAVVTELGTLPGVYVYTAQPWTERVSQSEEYYYAEELPEWIQGLQVDESNYDDYSLNIVSVLADALPAGTAGRYAIVYIMGRGVKAETPIIVTQGEVDLQAIKDELAAGVAVAKTNTKAVANDKMFNLAGQRVNDSFKGLVIKNGQKFMNK